MESAATTGGKSALYKLIQVIRPKPVKLITRFEGLPGDRITSYNVCYTKLLRVGQSAVSAPLPAADKR